MKVHFVVNAVIFNEDKVLLVNENNGGWMLPGGHIEENEVPDQAIFREVKEELGSDATFIDFPQLFSYGENAYSNHNVSSTFTHIVNRDGGLDERHINYGLVYIMNLTNEVKPMENQKTKWITISHIDTSDIVDAVKDIINNAVKQRDLILKD